MRGKKVKRLRKEYRNYIKQFEIKPDNGVWRKFKKEAK